MNITETQVFRAAERFILRNARPLDIAVWNYRYRGGNAGQVLETLAAFENPDGGFGWGLEPDCLNPNSSPVQTLTACGVLREIGFTDRSHPIIQGILRYLDSGADFDENAGEWLTTVPTTNDYPHAVWWTYDPLQKPEQNPLRYNPTAALAGFILCYAEQGSALYEKGKTLAEAAVSYLASAAPEPHVTGAFAMLYGYMRQAGIPDRQGLKEMLLSRADAEICGDSSRWAQEYLPKPSDYINEKGSIFYPGREALCREECRLILQTQLPDGSFPVKWQWFTDYKEYALSANWWKSRIILNNMRFLAEFGGSDDTEL